MHQADAGAPGGPSASGEVVFPADIDRLLARSDTSARQAPGDLRALRDDLARVLAALAVAGKILSADVAVLRRCLAGDARFVTRDPGEVGDLVESLPGVLAARPWGRGWSAPPHRGADEDDDPEVLVRSGPLWSTHHVMAAVDLTSERDVAAALAHIEEQLVDLCAWRSAVEVRLAAARAAIIGEWSARIDRSLETPA